MSLIDDIRLPIAEELDIFKHSFVNVLKTNNPLLSKINEYIIQNAGKQLRPILTILTAKLCGKITDATYYGALAIELIHNASLLHDDVVDDTPKRRGKDSVKAKWSNKIAVLSGDFVFSKSLECGTQTGNLNILMAISIMGKHLAEGELLQLQNTRFTETSENDYFEIIRNKTAWLFSTCTEVGALSVNAQSDQINHLKTYGEYLGLCFQIKDDIFDYYKDITIGKPTGNDIHDGKITLPLIYALRKSSDEERGRILKIIYNKDFTDSNIDYITHFAHSKGGVKYAEERMYDLKNKAISELDSFPESDVKDALIKCVEFATSRIN